MTYIVIKPNDINQNDINFSYINPNDKIPTTLKGLNRVGAETKEQSGTGADIQ